jgi:hypothetical protein
VIIGNELDEELLATELEFLLKLEVELLVVRELDALLDVTELVKLLPWLDITLLVEFDEFADFILLELATMICTLEELFDCAEELDPKLLLMVFDEMELELDFKLELELEEMLLELEIF